MILTTITPVWGRAEQLRIWLRAVRGATIRTRIRHFVYFVGEDRPLNEDASFVYFHESGPPQSIGHYHNLGANQAQTPWIMKLDVDTLPNVEYFEALLPILEQAGEREWFNGGMFYVNEHFSKLLLTENRMPLSMDDYRRVILHPKGHTGSKYDLPQATNFICRREAYLGHAMSDDRFKGYGWEDYQQIYDLEFYQQGKDPLPGLLGASNVTQRCREEIARRKALELYQKDERLALLHRWHPVGPAQDGYRSGRQMTLNRQVLLDCIQRRRAFSNDRL